MSNYVPLHFRSYYSLMKGLYSPEELCGYASRWGYKALGMVDINNFYGLMAFIKAANKASIKPIAGVVVRSGREELFTAYIISRKGFARICTVLSRLLVNSSLYFPPPAGESYDPVADLVRTGWGGLALVSDNERVLAAFLNAGREELFYKLKYGKSLGSRLRSAYRMGIPVLALNEAVSLNSADERIYNILRAIDNNTSLFKLPSSEKIRHTARAVNNRQMENYFSAVPAALENAVLLAERADISFLTNQGSIFPAYNNQTSEETFNTLRGRCYQGIKKRYGTPSRSIIERLDYELDIIREKDFSSYFLVISEIAASCPGTSGGGNSASSLVSYLLGITHVNPLEHNLSFEHFLSRERKAPPEIDVDFPWDERDNVLEYVFERYKGTAAMVAEHVTFESRSGLRETAKAMAMPEQEIDRIMSLHNQKRTWEIPADIRKTAYRIKNFPRYISQHGGGVVITPGPINRYTHIQLSDAGYPIIAWEKEGIEMAGLVKMELSGSRSLAVLRDTMELVGKRHHREINWGRFNPLEDTGTRELLENGNTIGIFYIESPATRQLLKKMKRGNYENIAIAGSIIRHAANSSIRRFVERLHGAPFPPLHPLVEKTLEKTYGILVYQEDISHVAIDLTGFRVEEADTLRKLIVKKKGMDELKHLQDCFIAGGRARGVSLEVLNRVWQMILLFQKGYSFRKAQSASFALVSCRLAYLKRFYPVEFFVSVINNGGGYYSMQTYLNEIKRLGSMVLAPDINRSKYRFSIEGRDIRVGLSRLCELPPLFLGRIITERQTAPFKDLGDLIRRLDPGLRAMRILIRSGTLDSIAGGLTRPLMFWYYFTFSRHKTLFLLPPVPEFIRDYSDRVKIMDERKTLGLFISRHPARFFKKKIMNILNKEGIKQLITSRELPLYKNKDVYMAGFVVAGNDVLTKINKRMVVVSFEDAHSIYETVFFPGSYKQYYPLVHSMGVHIIYGQVIEDMGVININVKKIITIQ